MEVSRELITRIELNESDTKAFMMLIDKVEKHRCNEGDVIRLSIDESKLLTSLHNNFFTVPMSCSCGWECRPGEMVLRGKDGHFHCPECDNKKLT